MSDIDGKDITLDDVYAINNPTSEPNTVEEAGSREAFLSTFTAEDDKAIMKKVDRRFLFLIGMIYLTKNLDYSNAASVKVLQVGQSSNILEELHMSTNQYNWVQSCYYISYIIFEIPSNLLLKRFTPRLWQSRIIFTWGAALACHAAIKNKEGYYALRFALGAFEAGMFPGFAAQLCSWYRSDEMGKPYMWMYALQNCSGVVGSLICYGVSYMNGLGGLSAWRWVYLLEGIYTMLLGIAVFLILPDYPKSPRSSTWLTPREQEYIQTRLSENAPQTHDSAFTKSEIYTALRDPRNYAFCLSQLLVNFGGYGLQWYLPTIVTDLGFVGLPKNQLLNIPPAAAAVGLSLFVGWFIDKAYMTRPAVVQVIMVGVVTFFVVLCATESRVGVYVAVVLGTMFEKTFFVPYWSWRSSTLQGMTGTAFSLAVGNCIGQIGGVIAPQLFQSKFAYNGYRTPLAICTASIIAAWAANTWTWWLTRNVEEDVRRIKRLRIEEEKKGNVYTGEDVKVFEERKFYTGLLQRKGKGGGNEV